MGAQDESTSHLSDGKGKCRCTSPTGVLMRGEYQCFPGIERNATRKPWPYWLVTIQFRAASCFENTQTCFWFVFLVGSELRSVTPKGRQAHLGKNGPIPLSGQQDFGTVILFNHGIAVLGPGVGGGNGNPSIGVGNLGSPQTAQAKQKIQHGGVCWSTVAYQTCCIVPKFPLQPDGESLD